MIPYTPKPSLQPFILTEAELARLRDQGMLVRRRADLERLRPDILAYLRQTPCVRRAAKHFGVNYEHLCRKVTRWGTLLYLTAEELATYRATGHLQLLTGSDRKVAVARYLRYNPCLKSAARYFQASYSHFRRLIHSWGQFVFVPADEIAALAA